MPRWQVYCAVALRRLPEIVPSKDPIELKIQQLYEAYEASKSRYSKHEIEHMRETELKESGDTDVIIKETAQDRLDKWIRAKNSFEAAAHDERLSKMQYLFIKSRFGTDIKEQWLLPQAPFDRDLGDQNLMDTARRTLRDTLSLTSGFTIVSKVPSSHLTLKYPRKVVGSVGFDGAKVFFLKANLDPIIKAKQCALVSDEVENLKWLTRDEARQLVRKDYIERLARGLLSEDRVDVEDVLKKAALSAAGKQKIQRSLATSN